MLNESEHVVFGPLAQRDAAEIYIYTADTWSTLQARKYLEKLKTGFEQVVNIPGLWRQYTHLGETLYYVRSERHYGIFRAVEKRIFIIGLIGDRMDFEQRVQELLSEEARLSKR